MRGLCRCGADRSCWEGRQLSSACRQQPLRTVSTLVSTVIVLQPTTTTPIKPFSSSRAYRWPGSALRTPRTLRLWPPGHACDGACECVRRGHGAPRERLYGSQAASSSLKSSSSTHATSLYGARCCGGVRARASATPASRCLWQGG